jgi:hypothetical protein
MDYGTVNCEFKVNESIIYIKEGAGMGISGREL